MRLKNQDEKGGYFQNLANLSLCLRFEVAFRFQGEANLTTVINVNENIES